MIRSHDSDSEERRKNRNEDDDGDEKQDVSNKETPRYEGINKDLMNRSTHEI